MKKSLLLLAVIASLVWNGCIPTLHPLLTEEDAVFDPALLGTWREPDDENTHWTFSRTRANAANSDYTLVIQEGGKTNQFDARLGTIRGKRFLMLRLAELDEGFHRQNDWAQASVVRGYLFLRVYEVGSELKMSLPDFEPLDKLLKKNPKALGHFRPPDGGLVLTGSTAELQAFFGRHADDPKMFKPADEGMKRLPDSPRKQP